MTYEFSIAAPEQSLLRPWQRAIVLVSAITLLALGALIAHPETGIGRLQWPDFVFGAIANGVVGLASGMSALWRLLIGLLVAAPIDQLNDFVIGRPSAFNVERIVKDSIQTTILTWLLPYLDPPRFVQRWAMRSPSRTTSLLRHGVFYVGYSIWVLLVVVIMIPITLIAGELLKGLAGYPDVDGEVFDVPSRIKVGIGFVLIAAVSLAISFGVRHWRRRSFGGTLPETPRGVTAIPSAIADAVRDSADPQR